MGSWYSLTACNYSYMQLGLIDYNARFYSPALGRFIQPDTIIPDLTNSQAWNRYSYVLNSPIMYVDPCGHSKEFCSDEGLCVESDWNVDDIISSFGVDITEGEDYSKEEKTSLLVALYTVGSAFRSARGGGNSAQSAFKSVFKELVIKKCNNGKCDHWNHEDENIGVTSGMITYGHTTVGVTYDISSGQNLVNNFIHELGHVYNNTHGGATEMGAWLSENEKWRRTSVKDPKDLNGYYNVGLLWQQGQYDPGSEGEEFADSFLGWAYGLWEVDNSRPSGLSAAGESRSALMDEIMSIWYSP